MYLEAYPDIDPVIGSGDTIAITDRSNTRSLFNLSCRVSVLAQISRVDGFIAQHVEYVSILEPLDEYIS